MSDYITIPLSKTGKNAGKYEAIVSIEDAGLANYNWSFYRNHKTIYVNRRQSKKGILLHRVIMERILGRALLTKEQVDHINHNGLDNRRSNLRLATQNQNQHNSTAYKNNTSGYKGVTWHKQHRKWYAQIVVNNKHIYLGLFTDPKDAHAAYCEAAKKHFGNYANLDNEA